ncbi:MAG: hypothetical protein NC935_06275 [Candidatus Omnitrophica bacterium]|nr:hypothetical protein [Candidatus Omnitrophota bacterium]
MEETEFIPQNVVSFLEINKFLYILDYSVLRNTEFFILRQKDIEKINEVIKTETSQEYTSEIEVSYFRKKNRFFFFSGSDFIIFSTNRIAKDDREIIKTEILYPELITDEYILEQKLKHFDPY